MKGSLHNLIGYIPRFVSELIFKLFDGLIQLVLSDEVATVMTQLEKAIKKQRVNY